MLRSEYRTDIKSPQTFARFDVASSLFIGFTIQKNQRWYPEKLKKNQKFSKLFKYLQFVHIFRLDLSFSIISCYKGF